MIGYLVIFLGFAYFGIMKLLCDYMEKKYWKK